MTAAPLPVLFVPHGAPTFALRPGDAGAAMSEFAARLPRPRAIVVISAHWETHAPTIGTTAACTAGETIHDFWGFPEGLYNLDYPAAGDPAVSQEVLQAFRQAGFAARLESNRGIDHGAWIPLRPMYTAHDIPVIPVSLQSPLGPEHHFALGRALAGLPQRGVLVVASGNLTHNLRDYQLAARGSGTPAYVREFADWIWAHIGAKDIDLLIDYRAAAPHGARAHPSEEHLLPLHVALGAAGEHWRAERIYSGVEDHVLAMDSFALWPDLQGKQQ